MQFIEPKVFVVAETVMDKEGLVAYLNEIGAEEWVDENLDLEEVPHAIPECSELEKVVEVMGRLCYRSWAPGLNQNVTKIREGNDEYLANILKTKHGSVTEHGSVSFIFHDVSRVFTHELVRHRQGVAISQESLRYVRLTNLKAYLPMCFAQDAWAAARMRTIYEMLEKEQLAFAEHFQLDAPGTDFNKKKQITSAMRRLAPIGLATAIGWTANIRTLRFVLALRTHPSAEEEIRLVFKIVGEVVRERYPNLFSDMTWIPDTDGSGLGYWRFENEKI